MKKLTLGIAFIACTFSMVFSQKKDNGVKYEKVFYKNSTIETNEATITVDDAVSTDKETKFKIFISNKTRDYIIYKPQESKFIIDGKELTPKNKNWEVIRPNDVGSIVVSLPGAGYKDVRNYTFTMDGIYRVAIGESSIPAEDYKLPPSQNEFKIGDFSMSMIKLDKETDKTIVKFKCTYNGTKVGVVNPLRIGVKMPDGNEYACVKPTGLFARSYPLFIFPGESESFNVIWDGDRMPKGKANDMQKVDMFIKWNAAFAEVSPLKLKSETLTLEFDEDKSNEKGR